MAYRQSIETNAKNFGNKTANLIYLKDNTPLEELVGIKFEIPEFCPLDHNIILRHLKTHIPDWDSQWEKFIKEFESQNIKTTIETAASKALAAMRETVIQCFTKHPLPPIESLEQFKAQIGTETLVMVRSTGKEDTVQMANPGGNESEPCVKMEAQELSSAIGNVVASYLSEKSLLQRLKSGDNITTEPFVPVLIQKMIGNQERIPSNAMPRSGVAFSDQGCTQIDAAPGHGELVVNSKGNVDNYYVTDRNKVYAEIRVKEERLESHFDADTQKSKLHRTPNSKALKYSSSLPESVIVAIHNYTQSLEKLYNMRMEIEFVYDPSRNTVCIVQARPIPLGDRKNMKPSAVPPEAESKILQEQGHCLRGQVITPDVTQAAVIKEPGELLVCDTINQALSIYLSCSPEDNSKIKAVIIKKPAPGTSHEAGEFSSKAIPVIQLEDLTEVKKWRDNLDINNNPSSMIVDLQRKSVYQVPRSILPDSLIQEGIFCSTLSAQVSPFKRDFSDLGMGKYTFAYTCITDIPQSNLADLIAIAEDKTKDMETRNLALNSVLDFEYSLMSLGAKTKYAQQHGQSPFSVQAMKQALLSPNLGQRNQDLKDSVCYLMYLLHRKFKKHGKFTLVVKEAMHSLAEVYVELERIESMAANESLDEREDKEAQDSTPFRRHYFNLIEKAMGNIYSAPKQDVLSESVVADLQEIDQKNTFEKEMVEAKLGERNQEYCLQMLKLSKFIISENAQDPIVGNWTSFCIENCRDLEKAKKLGTLLVSLVKLGVHETWINNDFRDAVKNSKGDMQQAFEFLYQEYTLSLPKLKDQESINIRIKNLENQIPLWADPNKFDELYASFQLDHNEIRQLLSRQNFDSEKSFLVKLNTLSLLNKYVDLMDKTFKSLEKSRTYSESQGELQATRFKSMLQLMKELMIEWVSPTELKLKLKYPYYLSRITSIDDKFIPGKNQLQPSKEFNVSSATIDQNLSCKAIDRNIIERCKTLEDYFTLMHQNLIHTIQIELKDMRKNSIYPQHFLDIQDQLKFLSIPEVHRGREKIALIIEDLSYPEIRQYYNIPLGNHSGKLSLIYNQKTKKTKVHFELFEGRAGDYLESLAITSQLGFTAKFTGKVISDFFYDRNKTMLSCELELETQAEAQDIFQWIRQVCAQTFEGRNRLYILKENLPADKSFIEKFTKKIHGLISSPTEVENFSNLRTVSKINSNFPLLRNYINLKKDSFIIHNPDSGLHDFFKSLNLAEKCIIFRKGIWKNNEYDDNDSDTKELQDQAVSPSLQEQIIESLVEDSEILIGALEAILKEDITEIATYYSLNSVRSESDTDLLKSSIQRILERSSEQERVGYVSKIGRAFSNILNHEYLKKIQLSDLKHLTNMMNTIMKGHTIPGPLTMNADIQVKLIKSGLDPQICPDELRPDLLSIQNEVNRKKEERARQEEQEHAENQAATAAPKKARRK